VFHDALAAFRVAALCAPSLECAGLSSQRDALVPVTAACRLGVAASMVGARFGSWARVD